MCKERSESIYPQGLQLVGPSGRRSGENDAIGRRHAQNAPDDFIDDLLIDLHRSSLISCYRLTLTTQVVCFQGKVLATGQYFMTGFSLGIEPNGVVNLGPMLNGENRELVAVSLDFRGEPFRIR